jgi:hypothetical protein
MRQCHIKGKQAIRSFQQFCCCLFYGNRNNTNNPSSAQYIHIWAFMMNNIFFFYFLVHENVQRVTLRKTMALVPQYGLSLTYHKHF